MPANYVCHKSKSAFRSILFYFYILIILFTVLLSYLQSRFALEHTHGPESNKRQCFNIFRAATIYDTKYDYTRNTKFLFK